MKTFLLNLLIFFNATFTANAFLPKESKIDSLLVWIEKGKYDKVEKALSQIDTINLTTKQKGDYYFTRAQILDIKNIQDIAFRYYLQAKQKYLSEALLENAMLTNYQMAFSTLGSNSNIYLNEIEEFLSQHKNTKILARFYFLKAYEATFVKDYKTSLEFLSRGYETSKTNADSLYMHKINSFIGLLHSQILNNPKLGLEYETKLYPYLERNHLTEEIINSKMNQAAAYYSLEDYNTTIEILKDAKNLEFKQYEKFVKARIYEILSLSYENLNDYKTALHYIHLNQQYEDSINFEKQDIAIREYEIQYETQKKELENNFLKQENTLLDEKQKTNRILFIVALGLLLSLIIATYFIIKYLVRKKKIAEQEKIIEQQKAENILKTQEISIIDAMVEGQEKERQLIAQDLHDNLGSMLTSLKLNFQHLRNQLSQNDNPMFDKTDILIDDAYQNVRRLAHAKNSGVVADKGLIPALKTLADKTSIPKKLKIQVSSFGMNSRLDMALEITIFRAIQEMITNSIKHASASKITISLTQHQDEINIIVEDNGKGFKKNVEEGMGLGNIRKKIDTYKGTFDIDSTPNGTTIIINLPI